MQTHDGDLSDFAFVRSSNSPCVRRMLYTLLKRHQMSNKESTPRNVEKTPMRYLYGAV